MGFNNLKNQAISMSQRPDSGPVPDIEKQISDISEKVPVLDALEKKAAEMNEIQPEMKELGLKLDKLADFSDMKMAKLAGNTIKQIYRVNDMSISSSDKAALLEDVSSKYQASKNSAAAMERTIAQMDSKIATVKAEKASIDNLPPIPAGPAVSGESADNFVNDGDSEPVEKKNKGGLRDTVTKMVTDDL
jgi:chromosome segregation ATPase